MSRQRPNQSAQLLGQERKGKGQEYKVVFFLFAVSCILGGVE